MRYKDRVKTLKKKLSTEKLNALLITKKENIAYLSGLDAEDSALLITTQDRDFVVTDSRFKQKVEEDLPDFSLKLIDGSRTSVIKDILKSCGIKRFGFESDWLTYDNYSNLKKKLKGVSLVAKKNLIEDLRIVKDPEEIVLIKRSISIIKKAYFYIKKVINPKFTGEELAVIIDNVIRREGASGSSFKTIVAKNPYSSCPHATSTKSPFGKNCAVLMDFGAIFKGYNSDLTRVLFLGRIATKFRDIYNIIKEAQEKAIKKIKPGIEILEIDRIARQHIATKGVRNNFLHSLGHGIGLEIHESPNISAKNKKLLAPGMVFTVEPGIYIEGWGGLRLEDMVLVTKNGCEVLTDDIPK